MLEMRSQVLPIFLARLRAAGMDLSMLGVDVGIDFDPEHESEVAIPLARFHAIGDALADRLGDPMIGLHAAMALPRGAYGLVEFVFRSAPTTREALDRLVRYVPLFNNLLVFHVGTHDGEVQVEARIAEEPLCLGRQANEFILAIFFKIGREIAGQTWSPHRVWFAHAAPPDTTELVRYFGTDALLFAAGANGMSFDESLLDLPIPTADDALYSLLDREARERVVRLGPNDELEPLREKVRLSLQKGEPNIERVAHAMGMSTRALQRWLASKGTSFRGVTDDVRRALAQVYLQDYRRPLTEVAFLLGYADLRAFARAYKRWTGTTPGASRKR
ncbi:MAG TPA: AraC family transcriptional regulator [Polyangiaceae bacterium]